LNQVIFDSDGDYDPNLLNWKFWAEKVKLINYSVSSGKGVDSKRKHKKSRKDRENTNEKESENTIVRKECSSESAPDGENTSGKESNDCILGKEYILCSVIWNNPQSRYYFF
jgi:hypothetical protein